MTEGGFSRGQNYRNSANYERCRQRRKFSWPKGHMSSTRQKHGALPPLNERQRMQRRLLPRLRHQRLSDQRRRLLAPAGGRYSWQQRCSALCLHHIFENSVLRGTHCRSTTSAKRCSHLTGSFSSRGCGSGSRYDLIRTFHSSQLQVGKTTNDCLMKCQRQELGHDTIRRAAAT